MKEVQKEKSVVTSSVTLSLVGLVFALFFLTPATSSAEELRSFIVEPAIPVAGEDVEYGIAFDLKVDTYKRLNKGGFAFEFPEGFGLGSIDSILITDNHPGRDPEIKKFTVDGRVLKLSLRVKLGDDDDKGAAHKVHISIKVLSIRNTIIPGEYRLAGWAYKKESILAGPTLSQPFIIGLEEPVGVLEIVSTDVIAPNSPKVNTGQAFQIRTLIANTGFIDVSNVPVQLSSNGQSSFDSAQLIDAIAVGDTAEVSFDVIAAGERIPSELFEVSISQVGIEVTVSDDAASVVIQTPAILAMSSSINDGDTIAVTPGQQFRALYQLSNVGEASTGNGEYEFSTTGVDFGIDSLQTGDIVVGEPLFFDLIAPSHSDTVDIEFHITERPLDLNSLEPAALADTSVVFTVIIEGGGKQPPEVTYIVENNPFNPDDGPVEFKYELAAPTTVTFHVFTITGEEVYSAVFLPGEKGGQAGENIIEWDGRNDEGDVVLNGVYVTRLAIAGTGQITTLKLAVIK